MMSAGLAKQVKESTVSCLIIFHLTMIGTGVMCRKLESGEGRWKEELNNRERGKLQALVYDILPSTTAVFSYAIGSRKLSANEQFFCWCPNSSKFVTNNSDYIRRLLYN